MTNVRNLWMFLNHWPANWLALMLEPKVRLFKDRWFHWVRDVQNALEIFIVRA